VLRGPLRVAAPLTFSNLYLGRIFAAFAVAHPQVELTVDCDDSLIDIAGGGYDLAIRIGRLADSSLLARRLAPAPAVIVASPAYLEAHGTPKTIADLARHRSIAYGHMPMAHQWRFEGQGANAAAEIVTLRPQLTVNNGEMICDAAIAGLGLALLPLFIAGAALREGTLLRVLPNAVPESGAVYAVWPPGSTGSRKLRALLDLLAERLPRDLAASGALDG
jgi:DNA-binding transcriptional LysR family regulator